MTENCLAAQRCSAPARAPDRLLSIEMVLFHTLGYLPEPEVVLLPSELEFSR